MVEAIVRMGRPPKYDFRYNLENVGDSIVVPKFDVANARNAVSQFKSKMKEKGIEWNYTTETLLNGDLKIYRTRTSGTALTHERDTFIKQSPETDILKKGLRDILNQDLPYGIWYCVNSDGEPHSTVLFNKAEIPILEKFETNGLIKVVNRENYSYLINKTGWLYKEYNTAKTSQLAMVYLLKWIYGEIKDKDFYNSSKSDEPERKTSHYQDKYRPAPLDDSAASIESVDSAPFDDDDAPIAPGLGIHSKAIINDYGG
jgi:hypothetical protein